MSATKIPAGDPAKASQNYKVLLENNRMRALEYRSKPGEKTVMHSHPAIPFPRRPDRHRIAKESRHRLCGAK